MAIPRRTYRRAQLWGVRASDPAKLVSLYRYAVGLDVLDQLPAGVTFTEMVDTILDRDEISRLASKVMQAVVGKSLI